MLKRLVEKINSGEIYYAYEAIVFTLTGKPVAYEQLLRSQVDGRSVPPGEIFIGLGSDECAFLDLISLFVANERSLEWGIPVTVNTNKDSLELVLRGFHFLPGLGIERRLGIELNEDLDVDDVNASLDIDDERIWWLLDDFTQRGEHYSSLHSKHVELPGVTYKIPWECTQKICSDIVLLELLPRNRSLVAEGAQESNLRELFNQGVSLAQGRNLNGNMTRTFVLSDSFISFISKLDIQLTD